MSAAVAYSSELSNDDLRVSPAAQEVMSKLFSDVEDDDITSIRVFVSGGGCSGMTYGMTFTGDVGEYDKIMKFDGFQVAIDTVAYHYLQGVEIDYVERAPGSASFVFNNVFQATGGSGACGGCGGGGCA